MRLIAGHAERWEALRLQQQPTHRYNYFRRVTPSKLHFAALRHLQYHSAALEHEVCLGHHFDVSALPNITSVQIVAWTGIEDKGVGDVRPIPPEAHFPWGRLQHVYLSDFRGDGNSILDSLVTCPTLSRHILTTLALPVGVL